MSTEEARARKREYARAYRRDPVAAEKIRSYRKRNREKERAYQREYLSRPGVKERARELANARYASLSPEEKEARLKKIRDHYRDNGGREKARANVKKRDPARYAEVRQAYRRRRFFYMRALYLLRRGRCDGDENRGEALSIAVGLALLWRRQNGRCVVTGRRLDRDRSAHVDHIVPLSRGGTNDIGNLRWVHADVNLAKQALPDAEFIALCRDVLTHAGLLT